MSSRRTWTRVLQVAAALAGLIGLGLCGLYLDGTVIRPAGQADRSALFWHLPILFMGLGALALGVVLWLVARHRVPREAGSL